MWLGCNVCALLRSACTLDIFIIVIVVYLINEDVLQKTLNRSLISASHIIIIDIVIDTDTNRFFIFFHGPATTLKEWLVSLPLALEWAKTS